MGCLCLTYCGLVNHNPRQVDDELSKEYILRGSLKDDESAFIALQRESMMTYQINLPKYLEDIPKISTNVENDFNAQDFPLWIGWQR